MSDNFIREIDEEVRRDRLADLWRRYSALIVGVLVLGVVAVGGWRFYEYRQQLAAQAQSAQLETALKASREQRGEDAEKALADIARGGGSSYALVARFRLAGEVGRRDASEGSAAFDALAADAAVPQVLRDLARLRAGALKLDTATYAELRPSLEPAAANGQPFRHAARELLGIAALKARNFDEAGRWFDQILADREAPQGLRQRVDIYLALVRAGEVEVK